MEAYKAQKVFLTSRSLTRKEIETLTQICSQDQGIIGFELKEKSILLEYYKHLQSDEAIKLLLEKSGFPLVRPKKEGFFTRFLKRLAKENKQAFGDKPLDCCDLNH